jgi:uncharacterized membrane protein YraQ (UPF0718 family)
MNFDFESMLLIFTSILYEALPFIVLGVIISGFLEEFVPQQIIAGLFKHGALSRGPARLAAIALGGVLGLVFPMCECGIVPIMQRLLRKGVPVGVCISYMLAGPIINVVVISATYVAFNPSQSEDYLFPWSFQVGGKTVDLGGPIAMVGLRVGLGFVVACVTGLVVEWQYRRHGNSLFTPAVFGQQAAEEENSERPRARRTPFGRIGNVAGTALHDFVDIMAFLVIGAGLAAIVRTSLDQTQFSDWVQTTPAVAILVLMGLAIAICLCSEADAFIAAALPRAVPPAAKVAFVVLGPMLDFKLLLMYTRVFRKRLILTIVVAVVVQVFLYTLLLHYLVPDHGFSEAFLRAQGR